MSEKRTTDPSQVIPFAEKFGYALGDFASNLFWMPFILFGTFFYTDVFGISALSVGWMFLVTRIWDTVIDPVVGMLADRSPPRAGLGKYRPFLFWVAVPFGVVCSACFFTPDLSDRDKLIYAWVTYTLFGITYSAINVPYSALMSVMSKEPEERSSTSYFRMIGAQAAGLLISSTLLPLVSLVGGENKHRGFFIVMSGFAVLAVVCFLVTGKMTRERVEPEPKEEGDAMKDLKHIVTNVPWLILFFVSFFTITAFTIRFGVAAYYFKYYADAAAIAAWGDGVAISMFFTLGSIASLLGVFAFSFFSKTLDKKKMYYVLILVSGGISLLFAVIPSDAILIMILTQALFSFLTGPTAAILFAMYTDISAHIKNESGCAADGLVMSAGSFAQKFGWAVGGALAGLLLGWAGYVPDKTQSDEVKSIMSVMMSWAPMAACVLGAFAMMIYPLDNKRMRKITEELAAKAAKAGKG